MAFVKVCFESIQAGLEARRSPVRFFTTNYDTLLEDALALCRVSYWDGFDGGAVAFRSHRFGEPNAEQGSNGRACVIKLHGSIDWQLDQDGRVWRVRDQDNYLEDAARVLIYPQATKYFATQRDPFAAQFSFFRQTLESGKDNVLAVCGYSFGDEHINGEITAAMARAESKTTLLAFCREDKGGSSEVLETWRHKPWGERVYVVSQRGIYCGQEGPYCAPDEGKKRNWWTFQGVTALLRNGVRSFV